MNDGVLMIEVLRDEISASAYRSFGMMLRLHECRIGGSIDRAAKESGIEARITTYTKILDLEVVE